MPSLPFLKVSKTGIVDDAGKPVLLKGVNLGGWLMMEGYLMGGRNVTESSCKNAIAAARGKEALDDFTRSFRDIFIQESDIALIKEWGANCIRIPFNYRLIEFEDRPYSLNEEGLAYLDRAVEWCDACGIYCILDMHAAPGAQNGEWHSDSSGKAELFASDANRDRYRRLWHFIADRYKDASAVAGYDLLNEPMVSIYREGVLKDLYDTITGEIRDADKNHIIFLEGNFLVRLSFLGKPKDPNTAYSIHAYPIPDFAFNWERGLRYPGRFYGIPWDRDMFERLATPYRTFSVENDVPVYIGEFGVNYRDGHYGEIECADDMISVFEKFDLHWTYWTYKSVANSIFPDGVFRYLKNPSWVNRQGPLSGLETFAAHWPKEKGRMISSWRTENFTRNDKLYSVLRKHFVGKR